MDHAYIIYENKTPVCVARTQHAAVRELHERARELAALAGTETHGTIWEGTDPQDATQRGIYIVCALPKPPLPDNLDAAIKVANHLSIRRWGYYSYLHSGCAWRETLAELHYDLVPMATTAQKQRAERQRGEPVKCGIVPAKKVRDDNTPIAQLLRDIEARRRPEDTSDSDSDCDA